MKRSHLLYVLALAAALGLGVAVPVFAQEEPADGGTVEPQVVGGDPVPDGKNRFVASIQDITSGNSAYRRHFCGGTLIDRDSVLTAAHCVETRTAAQLRVIVGRTKLDSSQGQVRSVRSIARHPRYVPEVSRRYDAAVLNLGSAVRNIAPVDIPQSSSNGPETPGRLLTIAGWGNTIKQGSNLSQPDSFPKRMQEAKVPVVSDDRAKKAYGSVYARRLMVAAGREGKDTCQGDSGGPMFLRKGDGRVLQVGITSFGRGCGLRGYPGVYAETNSADIRPFIYDRAAR